MQGTKGGGQVLATAQGRVWPTVKALGTALVLMSVLSYGRCRRSTQQCSHVPGSQESSTRIACVNHHPMITAGQCACMYHLQ